MLELTPGSGRPTADTTVTTPVPASTTATPPPQQPYAPENETHLLDRLAVLYRYRRIALAVFVLATAAMMIQGYGATPVYQAKAQIEINDERSTAVPGINNADTQFYEDPEPYYNTQYKILAGRDLARKIVKKLHLETVPEFNGTAVPAPTPLTLIVDLKTKAWGLFGQAPAVPQEAPKIDETQDESNFVSAFIGRIGVIPDRRSRLVDVTFASADARFAAVAANTLVEEYVEQNLSLKLKSTENMLEWLGQ